MIDALLLLQDVQLICFTVIFFFVSRQYPNDRPRRWLFYNFAANSVGALLDFFGPHLPMWLSRGLNLETIPISYALTTVAFVYFLRRHRWSVWVSFALVAVSLPLELAWANYVSHIPGDTLVDAVLGVQVLILAIILPQSSEKSTRSPRWLMAGFFYAFAIIEFSRAYIVFILGRNPDANEHGALSIISSSAYVVSTSVLPLAFIWMMNSRVEADLLQQNMLDPLTHVLNRRGLRRALEREMEMQEERGTTITIAMMDFDHFKALNDTYGHPAGDTMLIGITQMLRQMLRENDTIARIGGEEFVIILPETDATSSLPILERLRQEVDAFVLKDDTKILHLTASFGATVNAPTSTIVTNDLLNPADVALYRAKRDGRNCVRFFAA